MTRSTTEFDLHSVGCNTARRIKGVSYGFKPNFPAGSEKTLDFPTQREDGPRPWCPREGFQARYAY